MLIMQIFRKMAQDDIVHSEDAYLLIYFEGIGMMREKMYFERIS